MCGTCHLLRLEWLASEPCGFTYLHPPNGKITSVGHCAQLFFFFLNVGSGDRGSNSGPHACVVSTLGILLSQSNVQNSRNSSCVGAVEGELSSDGCTGIN